MQSAGSLKFVANQLSSIMALLKKLAAGASLNDVEWLSLSTLHKLIVEWIILQKSIKLEYAKPDILGRLEPFISEGDYYKIGRSLETLKPCFHINEQRLNRIIGQRDASGKMNLTNISENLNVIFDIIKSKADAQTDTERDPVIEDHTLNTIEAICEVVNRVLKQA